MVCQVSGPPAGVAAVVHRSFPEGVPPPELYHKFVLLSRSFFFFSVAVFRLHCYSTTSFSPCQALFFLAPGLSCVLLPSFNDTVIIPPVKGDCNTFLKTSQVFPEIPEPGELLCVEIRYNAPYGRYNGPILRFLWCPRMFTPPKGKAPVERIYFKNYYR